jgi:Dolichyl-phosphate-mannose-protein mannosyltransferase
VDSGHPALNGPDTRPPDPAEHEGPEPSQERAGTRRPGASGEPAGSRGPGASGEPDGAPAGTPGPVGWRRWSTLDRLVMLATWAVVALGIAVRVRQWAFGRSFWADEDGLWLAMHGRGYAALTEPLPSGQAAPIGWLWSEHLVMSVFGDGERAARLLPLLFGCGALVLAAVLARSVLGGPAALATTILVATSPLLVYYSNEFKQYSADVFWSLALLLIAAVLLDRPLRARSAALLAAFLATCIWFSHAAVLTAAGVLGALGLLALLARQWRRLLLLVGAAVPLVVSLAVEYEVALSKTVDNDTLQGFWKFGFPPKPLRPDSFKAWVADSGPRLLSRPFSLHHGLLLLVLVAAGALVLAVWRTRLLLVLLLPLVVLLAGAILHVYPAADRLVLFAVPTVLLLAAAPVALLRRYPSGLVTAIAAVLAVAAAVGVGVLATPGVRESKVYLAHPLLREETRPVVQYIAEHRQPGDLVLIDTYSLPISVYGRRYGLPQSAARVVRAPSPSRACVPGAAEKIIKQRYRRVWLMWGLQFTGIPAYNRDGYRAHLSTIGRRTDVYLRPGAGAELYDLRDPAPDPQGHNPLLRVAGARCLDIRGLS